MVYIFLGQAHPFCHKRLLSPTLPDLPTIHVHSSNYVSSHHDWIRLAPGHPHSQQTRALQQYKFTCCELLPAVLHAIRS